MKALFGLWPEMKPADINRILKPHGVRLVVKKSKEWGKQVTVTAHPVAVRARKPKPVAPADPAYTAPGQKPDDGLHPGGALS